MKSIGIPTTIKKGDKMMENIKDAILDLQDKSTYLDYLKSEYMFLAQDLMINIFDSEDDMDSESEEEILNSINELKRLKEKLLFGLDQLSDTIMLLNDELERSGRDDD